MPFHEGLEWGGYYLIIDIFTIIHSHYSVWPVHYKNYIICYK